MGDRIQQVYMINIVMIIKLYLILTLFRLLEETLEEMNEKNIETNVSKVRDEVFNTLSESLRSPGEPIITFIMSKLEPTCENQITSKE